MTRVQQSLLVIFASLVFATGPTGAAVPCQNNVCGHNTQCQEVGDRPVCSCLPGHFGNPITGCIRGDCVVNSDCPHNKACRNSQCESVCTGLCGQGANCQARNHIPVCSCPAGYTGDPFKYCRPVERNELCNPSPCGVNTKCDVIREVPTCSCLPGYRGSALKGCVPECVSDGECRQDETCLNNRCRQACSQDICGKDARCQSQNHRAVCSCPEDYIGNPYTSCRPECYTHNECPPSKPTCWYGKCTDPCAGACGQNADCRVRGEVAVCSCPRDMTGDPMVFCRPFSKEDLCNPNPCGENAICQPGKDSSNNDRPVCTCPAGFLGNALLRCRRGECLRDNECQHNQICEQATYECSNVCDRQCGVDATCSIRNHRINCSCPPGYTGNPTTRCFIIPYTARSINSYSRYYYD